MKSKWNVIVGRGTIRFATGSRGRGAGRGRTTRGFATSAAFAISATEKLKTFHDHAELAAFLTGLLIVPLVELQTAFHEQRAALFHVLRERFSLPAKSVHIHKGHFFLLLARFRGPIAIHREADFGDGHSLG